jgi:DNA polymerase (family 10)
VKGVRGFGEKTEARLLAAAERWLTRDKTKTDPVLLSQALELAALLQKRLLTVVSQATLVGALRRGEETVRELEFVIVGDAEEALRQVSGLRQVLRTDLERNVAYLTDGLILRLHPVESDRAGNALVLNTGTPEHLAALGARATARKIALSPLAAATPFDTEQALYRALDLPLIPAELRQGRDELEQAQHSDFGDLLELSDIAGMVHCHTTYSDGKHSIVEMARAAHALGMQYITITDHSPSAHYARGVTLDRLKAQWDEIDAARAEVPIRILRGTESDILADGSLDFPDDVLERFDVIIASIHARHRLDRAAMTARLTRALSLPVFKIWGHALGRILNHRDPIDCDVLAVLDALAGSRGAVEINADPHRLDLPPAWIPAARERGLPFVISVDAHSMRGLNVLRYGVTMARRGGIRKGEVLNAGSAEEFARRVQPTGSVSATQFR